MDPYLNDLAHRFPYQCRHLSKTALSFDLPHGWRGIFLKLCHDVERQLSQQEKEAFRWIQVKEKYGLLHAYFSFMGPELESAGNASDAPLVQTNSLKEVDQETRSRINAIVEAARDLSGTTCLFCGEPGEMRTGQGWIHPTCTVHSDSRWQDFPNKH